MMQSLIFRSLLIALPACILFTGCRQEQGNATTEEKQSAVMRQDTVVKTIEKEETDTSGKAKNRREKPIPPMPVPDPGPGIWPGPQPDPSPDPLPPPDVDFQQSVTGDEVPDSMKIITYPEQMPQFPGGDKALKNFLNKYINYPAIAREDGIEATVRVKFIVNADGKAGDFVLTGKKAGYGLDEEAIRVLKTMPEWIPGMQNNKPVRVPMTVPVKFSLE